MLDDPAVKSEVKFKKASAVKDAPKSTLLSNGGRPTARKTFNFGPFRTFFHEMHAGAHPMPSDQFLEMLLGLIEGDGSFMVIASQGCPLPRFTITQGTPNRGILDHVL
jgi:hypothetical protein